MAAGPPTAMPTSFNGLVGQGGQFAPGGQHILLQQQLYSAKQGPVYQAGLGPGQYALKALAPAGINGNATAQQMQQDLHTTDQHDRLAQQQHQPVTSAVGLPAPAAPSNALMSAHPAITGLNQPAQQQQQQAVGMQAAGLKQEPGSPPAGSPTSLAPAAGSSSPTPEVSVPATASQLTGTGTAAAGRFKLSAPSRLPAPDPSEVEAAAEYEKYLARWEEGVTMAQRWHRLSEKGVLGDIVEEWEEWQHDLMLQEIQRQNKTLAGRARKHKRDEPEVDMDAPRQTRTRRVPMALQDYQVEAVTGGTPEPPNMAGHGPAGPNAGAGVRTIGVAGGRGAVAQQPHNAALESAGMTFADTAAAGGARAQAAHTGQPVRRGPGGAAGAAAAGAKAQLAYSKQQQHDGYQQQQVARSAGHSNGYAVHQQQQHSQQHSQHQQQQHVAYGRVSAPQTSQGPTSWPTQPQQQQHHQQQQQRPNGSHYALNSQEMMHQILHMGSAVGSAIANNSATAPAGAAARMPPSLPGPLAAALPQASGFDYGAAFEAFSKVLGRVDPVAFTHHISAAMQQQFQQQQ